MGMLAPLPSGANIAKTKSATAPVMPMRLLVVPWVHRARGQSAAKAYGWIGHLLDFLCTRQILAHRDRRGLFSIHTQYGLLNRRPKQVSFFNFD
jgi:hypothetical protein